MKLLEEYEAACKVRRLAQRTTQTYTRWVQEFLRFHRQRAGRWIHPRDMGEADVEAFLTHLAVNRRVAASTQNQALGAILFLYRHVLEKDLGSLDVVRATKPKRLPTVLCKEPAGSLPEAREKHLRGAGVVRQDDRWMLKSTSLPDGMTLPRLRWARKEQPHPTSPAHFAVAFDTFASSVVAGAPGERRRPYFAFGLMSFFQRDYHSLPSSVWKSAVVGSADGEKHPADRTPTERLVKLQEAMDRCVVRHLGATQGIPILQTEISPEKAQGLRELHRLCD